MDPEVREGLARSWKALMAVGVAGDRRSAASRSSCRPSPRSGRRSSSAGSCVIAGAFLVAGGLHRRTRSARVVLRLIWALLTVIVGVWLIVEPHNGTLTLTLVLGIYFLFMGLTRIAVAFVGRGQPNAGLVGLSGVCRPADRHPRPRQVPQLAPTGRSACWSAST